MVTYCAGMKVFLGAWKLSSSMNYAQAKVVQSLDPKPSKNID